MDVSPAINFHDDGKEEKGVWLIGSLNLTVIDLDVSPAINFHDDGKEEKGVWLIGSLNLTVILFSLFNNCTEITITNLFWGQKVSSLKKRSKSWIDFWFDFPLILDLIFFWIWVDFMIGLSCGLSQPGGSWWLHPI